MSAPITSKLDILHAYRHLYRAGLRAVCFSKPSRYVLRDVLRDGFRDKKGVFEKEKIDQTILFLELAQNSGFESKLLKALTRISWERRGYGRWTAGDGHGPGQPWSAVLGVARYTSKRKAKMTSAIDGTEYEHFDRTLEMLNATAGLCLRL